MSYVYATAPTAFNSSVVSCDCLAHVYGNAADRPDREPLYPSDMSDEEWAAVRPLLPTPAWLEGRGGQPGGFCHRQMLDAIRYLVAGGISWRSMPADFPAWARVYAFFRRWRENGLIAELHDRLRAKVREREGRDPEPSAGIIDAQSVKAAASVPAASRGYDGGKQVNGRKRHVVTDCLGLILVVAVTAANIGDREAATGLLARLRTLHREITLVWADGGYTGGLIGWCRNKLALTLEIVKRTDTDRPSRHGGTIAPGTDADTDTGTSVVTFSSPESVATRVSAADAASASRSSSRAITRRSSSISATSSAAAANAAASRSPSTRTRATASRSSSNPSIDATAHPSTIRRKQDARSLPPHDRNHADQRELNDHVRLRYGFSEVLPGQHQVSTGKTRGPPRRGWTPPDLHVCQISSAVLRNPSNVEAELHHNRPDLRLGGRSPAPSQHGIHCKVQKIQKHQDYASTPPGYRPRSTPNAVIVSVLDLQP